jgi:hypothetical protein
MSQDEVEEKLEEIRDRFASKTRLSWIYLIGMMLGGWHLLSDRGLAVFAVWIGILLVSFFALRRLGHEKMERLEQRGILVNEQGQTRERLPDREAESPRPPPS